MKIAGFDFPAIIREIKNLRRNPEDLQAGARLTQAFGGMRNADELVAMIGNTATGQRILKEKHAILPVLMNRQRLRALPRESLGYHYVEWADREGIYPEGLQEIMAKVQTVMEDETEEFVRKRLHDLHDLFHVITGYGRDPAGELAVLTFTSVQTNNRVTKLLSILGCLRAIPQRRFDVLQLRRQAMQRARQAVPLIAQDWVTLLELPIDQVRSQLKLWPLPEYRPMQPRLSLPAQKSSCTA